MAYYYELQHFGWEFWSDNLEIRLDEFRRKSNSASFRQQSISEIDILFKDVEHPFNPSCELVRIVSDLPMPDSFFRDGEVLEGPRRVSEARYFFMLESNLPQGERNFRSYHRLLRELVVDYDKVIVFQDIDEDILSVRYNFPNVVLNISSDGTFIGNTRMDINNGGIRRLAAFKKFFTMKIEQSKEFHFYNYLAKANNLYFK